MGPRLFAPIPSSVTTIMLHRLALTILLAICPLSAMADLADHPSADLLVPDGMSSTLLVTSGEYVGNDAIYPRCEVSCDHIPHRSWQYRFGSKWLCVVDTGENPKPWETKT
jgi:hypothetical protein